MSMCALVSGGLACMATVKGVSSRSVVSTALCPFDMRDRGCEGVSALNQSPSPSPTSPNHRSRIAFHSPKRTSTIQSTDTYDSRNWRHNWSVGENTFDIQHGVPARGESGLTLLWSIFFGMFRLISKAAAMASLNRPTVGGDGGVRMVMVVTVGGDGSAVAEGEVVKL